MEHAFQDVLQDLFRQRGEGSLLVIAVVDLLHLFGFLESREGLAIESVSPLPPYYTPFCLFLLLFYIFFNSLYSIV